MSDRSRGGIFAGVLLLGLGLVLLVMQFVPQVRAMDLWALFPLVVGLAFIGGCVYSRQYGFLIPGCILTGLGLGALWAKLLPGFPPGADMMVAGLGLGFLAIYPLDLLLRGGEPGQWWPLIPGGIIFATAVAPAFVKDFWQIAPAVALIVIGGAILVRAFGPGEGERSEDRQERRDERRARRHGAPVPAGGGPIAAATVAEPAAAGTDAPPLQPAKPSADPAKPDSGPGSLDPPKS